MGETLRALLVEGFAATLGGWLVLYLVHSTVLLGLAWCITRSRVGLPEGIRDTVWKVAVVGGIVTASLATIAQPIARQDAPLAPAPLAADASPEPMPTVPDEAAPAANAIAAQRPTTPGEPGPLWPPIARIVESIDDRAMAYLALAAWALGLSVGILRLLAIRSTLRRMLANREPLREGPLAELLEGLRRRGKVARRIRLTVSKTIASPVALGASEICVPVRALTDLGPAEQEAMLAHELGHLLRRDPQWLAATLLVENVFVFQPLNRVARREMQDLAEFLVDDWAAAQTGRVALAKAIAAVAGWIQESDLALSAMTGRDESGLMQRVERLLAGGPRVRMSASLAGRAAAPLAVAATALVAAPELPALAESIRIESSVSTTSEPVRLEDSGRRIVLPPGSSFSVAGVPGIRSEGNVIVLDGGTLKLNGGAPAAGVTVLQPTDEFEFAKDGSMLKLLPLDGSFRVMVQSDGGEPVFATTAGFPEAPTRKRTFLGVVMEEGDGALAKALGLDEEKIAVIDEVTEDSPAAAAGLEEDDIVTSVNGNADASPEAVREAIRAAKPGDTLTLGILRAGKPQTIAATLTERETVVAPEVFAYGPGTFVYGGEGAEALARLRGAFPGRDMAFAFSGSQDMEDWAQVGREFQEAFGPEFQKEMQEAFGEEFQAQFQGMGEDFAKMGEEYARIAEKFAAQGAVAGRELTAEEQEALEERLEAAQERMEAALEAAEERREAAMERAQAALERAMANAERRHEIAAERGAAAAERGARAADAAALEARANEQRMVDRSGEALREEAGRRMREAVADANLGLDPAAAAKLNEVLDDAAARFSAEAEYGNRSMTTTDGDTTIKLKRGRDLDDLMADVFRAAANDAGLTLPAEKMQRVTELLSEIGGDLESVTLKDS